MRDSVSKMLAASSRNLGHTFLRIIALYPQDLNGLNRHANLRKINDFAKRARTVKNHAIVISELSKKMPKVRMLFYSGWNSLYHC